MSYKGPIEDKASASPVEMPRSCMALIGLNHEMRTALQKGNKSAVSALLPDLETASSRAQHDMIFTHSQGGADMRILEAYADATNAALELKARAYRMTTGLGTA